MSGSVMNDLKATKDKYKKQLLAIPNVEGVGVGPQVSQGKPTGNLAIKIFVRKKKNSAVLAKEELIPSELDGFPTDVEEISVIYKRQPQ